MSPLLSARMHIEDLLGWQKTRIQTIGAAQNELVRHMGDFRKHLLDEELEGLEAGDDYVRF